eukprot:1537312-Rhodomonas_salina.2
MSVVAMVLVSSDGSWMSESEKPERAMSEAAVGCGVWSVDLTRRAGGGCVAAGARREEDCNGP